MTHINDEIDGCGMNQFVTVGHAGDTKITIKLLLVGLPLRHFGVNFMTVTSIPD